MKIKHLEEKYSKQEKERYSLAFMNAEGAIVYISEIITDEETGTLIFIEDKKKIDVENSVKFLNKLNRKQAYISRTFVDEIKAVISVLLTEMENKTISYDEIYDRLHNVEQALMLKNNDK